MQEQCRYERHQFNVIEDPSTRAQCTCGESGASQWLSRLIHRTPEHPRGPGHRRHSLGLRASDGFSGSWPRCSSAPAPCISRSHPHTSASRRSRASGSWSRPGCRSHWRSQCCSDRHAVIFTVIAVSAASIGAWAVSRIWGLPFGEHADQAEQVTVVDGLTVVMEAFTVVLAATLLSASVRRFRSRGYVLGGRRRRARTHLRAARRRKRAITLRRTVTQGDATVTRTTRPSLRPARANQRATSGASGHTHAATSASGSTAGQVTDLNGHVVKGVKAQDVAHEQEPDQLLDAPTRAVLASQLSATRAVALSYPTVADASAPGTTSSVVRTDRVPARTTSVSVAASSVASMPHVHRP